MENKRRKHFVFLVFYLAVYLIVFFCVEQLDAQPHILHTPLDDRIPFCEYFIIPYALWFLFVSGSVCYFAFLGNEESEYYRLLMTITMGLAVFFFTSVLYPNAQDMRPQATGDNIFGWFVSMLYRIDTPTNILPSLHVFDAVACCIALVKHPLTRSARSEGACITGCPDGEKGDLSQWSRCFYGIKTAAVILTILIILSTMFLKQHSVIDVGTALILNAVCYVLIYRLPFGEKAYCKISSILEAQK